jgi:hypothetical protein
MFKLEAKRGAKSTISFADITTGRGTMVPRPAKYAFFSEA